MSCLGSCMNHLGLSWCSVFALCSPKFVSQENCDDSWSVIEDNYKTIQSWSLAILSVITWCSVYLNPLQLNKWISYVQMMQNWPACSWTEWTGNTQPHLWLCGLQAFVHNTILRSFRYFIIDYFPSMSGCGAHNLLWTGVHHLWKRVHLFLKSYPKGSCCKHFLHFYGIQ